MKEFNSVPFGLLNLVSWAKCTVTLLAATSHSVAIALTPHPKESRWGAWGMSSVIVAAVVDFSILLWALGGPASHAELRLVGLCTKTDCLTHIVTDNPGQSACPSNPYRKSL